MGHKRLTYLDIPAARRKNTGSQFLGRLRQSLGDPSLTEDQRTAVLNKITHLNEWIAGTLKVDHVVEIVEEVPVVEEGSGEV